MTQGSPINSWPFGSRHHGTQTVPSPDQHTYRHDPNLHFPQLKNLHVSQRNTSLYHSLPNISFKSVLNYKKLCCTSYPEISVPFAAHPSLHLYHFFRSKDRIPFRPILHVYCLKCRSCGSSYFGETVRHLHMRISKLSAFLKQGFQVFLTILVITESQYPSMFVRTFVTKFSKMMRIQ